MYQRIDQPPDSAARAASRGGLDLAGLIAALLRRKRWIIGTTAFFMLAALLFGLFGPSRYTATIQVLMDPNELRVVDNVIRAQNQYSDSLIAQTESQIRVLTSDNVARRVIAKLKLDQDPEFVEPAGSGFLGSVRRLLPQRASGPPDPTLDALRALRKRISSKRAERTYVVDLNVWSHDPEKAALIANTLVESFMEEQASARAEAARRASASLASRLNELKERVMAAEERVEAYKREHGITTTGGQLVDESQLAELSTQLSLARARTQESAARYEQIRAAQRARADPGALPEAVLSATITALRTQLAEVGRRESELTTSLGPRHPQVAEVRSQARNIARLISEEITRIAEAARNDYERAKANEQSLADNLDRLKTKLAGTNDLVVRLRELMRDVQASRTIYEAFLVRTREVSEQERLDTANVRVISPAEPPQSRSFPPRTLLLLMAGLIFGLGAGVGLALLRDCMPAYLAAARTPTATALPAVGSPPPKSKAEAASVARAAPPAPAANVVALAQPLDAHEKIARLARTVVGSRPPRRKRA